MVSLCLSLFFNGAIKSKVLGSSCYCDSLFYLHILPRNVFSRPRINVDQKFLNFRVLKSYLGSLAKDEYSQASLLQIHILRNTDLDC